jgi:hypothetical protein
MSPPRSAVYLHATEHERHAALEFYEWNARLSSALGHDFARLEVGLRNDYDRVLTDYLDTPCHWTACGDQHSTTPFQPAPAAPSSIPASDDSLSCATVSLTTNHCSGSMWQACTQTS